MGARGSTRWHGIRTRQHTDPLVALDVRHLNRWGALRAGATQYPAWDSNYGNRFRIVTRTSDDGRTLTVDYPTSTGMGREAVELTWTACNYGGSRPWFRCPDCDTRRAVLYLVAGRFRCLRCHDLAFSSSREDEHARSLRRRARLRKRIGGKWAQRSDAIPPKPPGMSRKRYDAIVARLQHEIDRANGQPPNHEMKEIAKLLEQHERDLERLQSGTMRSL